MFSFLQDAVKFENDEINESNINDDDNVLFDENEPNRDFEPNDEKINASSIIECKKKNIKTSKSSYLNTQQLQYSNNKNLRMHALKLMARQVGI